MIQVLVDMYVRVELVRLQRNEQLALVKEKFKVNIIKQSISACSDKHVISSDAKTIHGVVKVFTGHVERPV